MNMIRVYIDENCKIVFERFIDVSADINFYCHDEGKRLVPINKAEKILIYGDDLMTAELFTIEMNEVEAYEKFKNDFSEKTKYMICEKAKEIEYIEDCFYKVILQKN